MSANLDKSLDDLVGNQRRMQGRNRRGRAARRGAAKTTSAGGVNKAKANKALAKPVHQVAPASGATSTSKIILSGLPADVSAENIKEYFGQRAGPIKKVTLSYDKNGVSIGTATIIFRRTESAVKALELNGTPVDGRPMKIEMVYDAAHAPVAPTPASLAERVTHVHKPQPKPATATKAAKGATNDNNKNNTKGRPAKGRKGRNPGRGKPKTVEELDAEMVDYFAADGNNATNGNAAANNVAQANAGEDVGMAEIS
ncbi:mRNA export protein mlo3 [Penicillium argentinense]|uniref:mRNA export protein mlo3 n=1 Tax=Penicillium argentinense TaxID=1131581 RepID=A0A9W9K9N7_9EURO|nr:mRNA export protein mlo3 [Penicillium argentinense]KAJ5098264.1 mRNA export protein mlo3 [Penicillium argentinense]